MVQLGNRYGQGIATVDAAGFILATGGSTVPQPSGRGDEMIGVHSSLSAALDDSLLDHLHGVFGQ